MYESPGLATSLLCTSGQATQSLWTQLPHRGLWRWSRWGDIHYKVGESQGITHLEIQTSSPPLGGRWKLVLWLYVAGGIALDPESRSPEHVGFKKWGDFSSPTMEVTSFFLSFCHLEMSLMKRNLTVTQLPRAGDLVSYRGVRPTGRA